MGLLAITTEYKGYKFRSRLEARWAVFFDALGIEWEYEVEGFILPNGQKYLPDFWLPILECYAEVKPKLFTKKEYTKCSLLEHCCLLLDTNTPIVKNAYYCTKIFDEDCFSHYVSGIDYGRVILEYSQFKKRLWFLFGESIKTYHLDIRPEILAKSARFEFGGIP
jgi:hypothetical protein